MENDVNYTAATAVLYYFIGKIQAAKPPFFKLNCAAYTKRQGELFGKKIKRFIGA